MGHPSARDEVWGCRALGLHVAASHRSQSWARCSEAPPCPMQTPWDTEVAGAAPVLCHEWKVQRCTALSKLFFKGACSGWSWDVAQRTLGTGKAERQSLLSQQMSLHEMPGMLDSHFRTWSNGCCGGNLAGQCPHPFLLQVTVNGITSETLGTNDGGLGISFLPLPDF